MVDIQVYTDDWHFVFPVAPEKIDISYKGVYVSWSSISEGSYDVPAGWQPTTISFTILLPAQCTLKQLYPAKEWQTEQDFIVTTLDQQGAATTHPATAPLHYVANFQQAIRDQKSKVHLSCDELNLGGYWLAKEINAEHSGAFGDINLTCTFTEYRTPSVSYHGAPAAEQAGTSSDAPPPPPAGTVPVEGQLWMTRSDETLVSIAIRAYGDSDPTGYAQMIWDFGNNADTITGYGGTQDGTLPVGIILKLPPFKG